MEHAITIGDLVKWGLIGGGILLVFWIIGQIIIAFGRGMSR